MPLDNHEMEVRAVALFRQGETRKARELQEAFLKEVDESGEDHCSCPAACSLHGNCVKCVVVHRGHGDHLPHCFQQMVNRRIGRLSELTEHSYKPGEDE